MTPRIFSGKQRQTLFILADGKCQGCGLDLGDNWEADHIIPWSKGGQTTIDNGQALCAECNRKKGNKMSPHDKWQSEFFDEYANKQQKDFLLVATPGGGKTRAAIGVAKDYLEQDVISQVIVVCPTEPLKRQWAKEAAASGIQLDPYWNGTRIKKGFSGIVITYSGIINNVSMLQWHCQQQDTLVIFDEIHHAGDQKTWGRSIKAAFENAARRLCLSGTPFRSDNDEIPFVHYSANGESVADFKYSYGDAIIDGVCRNIAFPSLDGDVSWWDSVNSEFKESSSFDEVMSEQEEAQRLRASLHPGQPFVKEMLKEADKKLNEIRQDDSRAGGLVVTMDTNHANEIAEILKKITGEMPTVVHSDIQESADLIAEFARNDKRWIVSVKMVSEGVDIPRLRVGAYCSNAVTELLFRQIIGRVIRRTNENDTWAWFYVPKDRRLVEFMERVKQELNHVIDQQYRRGITDLKTNTVNGEKSKQEIFVGVAIRNPDGDVMVTDGQIYDVDSVKKALEICHDAGVPVNEAQAAILVKKIGGMFAPAAPARSIVNDLKPDYLRVKELRSIINGRAYHIASLIAQKYPTSKSPKDIVRKIHFEWTRKPGRNKQEEAGLEELQEKLKWLDGQLDEPWKYIV